MKQPISSSKTAILGIGTALPVHSISQTDVADLIASSLQDSVMCGFNRQVPKGGGKLRRMAK
ncbi:hypothetical protein [Paenibacillus sp. P46E]|uniref:hypothetical protein n=1 Tax=Paenibacillus sp. P46E TaxID=1349436 RepID=UPI00093EA9C8|nr:hypothetical protein [Paenibacillus sp. P46E]OKP93509.1 hypothetical protein A3849_30490 [Paenibacillus sp. P46E]